MGQIPNSPNGHIYRVEVPTEHPASNFTPRIIPYFPGVAIPLESTSNLMAKVKIMKISPLAGKPPPPSMLVNVPNLIEGFALKSIGHLCKNSKLYRNFHQLNLED